MVIILAKCGRFDDKNWFPLGRVIGGTIHPGLMATAVLVYNVVSTLSPAADLQSVCIFLSPLFASMTTTVTYLFAKEVSRFFSRITAQGIATFTLVTGQRLSRDGPVRGSVHCYYPWLRSSICRRGL